MILVASGDSFVWGSELADSPHCGNNGHSKSTFSALLPNSEYICAAYPGIGNKEIVYRTMQAICRRTPDIVLVCWTWPGRDNILSSDEQIIELQNWLVTRNLPYMFTCVDNCIITNNTEIDYSQWFFFPSGTHANETCTPRGFYQWAIECGYKTGKDGHPLEEAHADAAILMKEKFNELVEKAIWTYKT